MTNLIQDLRYGMRMLAKNPGFTAVAAITLALGIGANTAIFSLIDAVLLKTLPVKNPEQLVLLNRIDPQGEDISFPYPVFEQFRERNQVFSSIFAFAYRHTKVALNDDAEEAWVQLASGQYFSALGINAARGRTLNLTDDQGGDAHAVAVISYDYWKRRLALDPAVVGKRVTIHGTPFSIVGVTPPGFVGVALDYSVDVWVPISMQPQLEPGSSLLNSVGTNWVRITARLKPGVSRQQAAADLNVIFQQYLRSVHAMASLLSRRVGLAPGSKPVSGMRGVLSSPLLMLMVIVGLVLLIACANIANLLLARAAARQREISIRIAIGAGRMRLIRQLLTESILLAILAGALGVLFAEWANGILLAFLSTQISGVSFAQLQFHTDWRLLAFTATVSLLAGIVFGLAPALRASRTDVVSVIKHNAVTLRAGGHRQRLDRLLLISQLATSLVLLVAAGLFVRSFQKLADVDLGFSPQNVVQLKFIVSGSAYSPAQFNNVWNQMLERIKATPGVVSASMSVPGLFSHSTSQSTISLDDEPQREEHLVHELAVTPGFFRTLQIPLLLGRDFSPADGESGPAVVIINETLAHRYFHNTNPVGKYLKYFGRAGAPRVGIVGVAKDTKYESVLAEAPPILYLPMAQFNSLPAFRVFEARTAGNLSSAVADLRRAVQSVDNNLPVEVRTLTDFVGQSLLLQQLVARLTGFFGLLGLLLACVGVYGLMSYTVAQRTSEIGIRMALGAERRDVLRLVLRETMALIMLGVAIGLTAAFAAARFVASQLFGLTATDPLTIALVTLILIAVAAFAGYLPARRATKVDPMVALRYE